MISFIAAAPRESPSLAKSKIHLLINAIRERTAYSPTGSLTSGIRTEPVGKSRRVRVYLSNNEETQKNYHVSNLNKQQCVETMMKAQGPLMAGKPVIQIRTPVGKSHAKL